MTSTSEKENIRIEAKRHRNAIEPNENEFEAAADIFIENIPLTPQMSVSTYWPKGKEFNPAALIEKLISRNAKISLPVIKEKGSKELEFAQWDTKSKLVKGPFGIMQPEITDKTKWENPDIVIVPLLAFDQKGNRLGYGGGYYDTTLRKLRSQKKIIAVGLAYSQQACLFKLPDEEHDEKLDWVITPVRPYRF